MVVGDEESVGRGEREGVGREEIGRSHGADVARCGWLRGVNGKVFDERALAGALTAMLVAMECCRNIEATMHCGALGCPVAHV